MIFMICPRVGKFRKRPKKNEKNIGVMESEAYYTKISKKKGLIGICKGDTYKSFCYVKYFSTSNCKPCLWG